jgi:hypothetical protein
MNSSASARAGAVRICILSDSHDRGPMMAAAVTVAMAEGAEAVIHCGDIIGGNTLRASLKLGMPIHAIHGNNLGDPVSIARIAHNSDEHAALPRTGCHAQAGRPAHLPHPLSAHRPRHGLHRRLRPGLLRPQPRNRSRQQPNIKGGTTWLVNPGTVAGLGAPTATWMLADLAH